MNRLFSVLLINLSLLIYSKSSPLDFDTFKIFPDKVSNLIDSSPQANGITYRLPNNTKPLNYQIDIFTDIHKSIFNFTGRVKIKLEVIDKNSDSIVIHYRQLKNFKAELRDNKLKKIDILPVNLTESHEFLTIKLKKGKLISPEYTLIVDYEGVLRKDNAGFYVSEYVKDGKKIYLATTQFESTDARHGFPCYDEPNKKATFEITIKHGPNYNALSNMPVIQKSTAGSGYVKTRFLKTKVMSTYLIAYVISDFKGTKSNSSNRPKVTHQVFSRPNAVAEQNFALTTGVKVLDSFEKYLRIDYALQKMDQIAIPDFAAGAMENWGLVTYREEALLYNKSSSTIFSQTQIANIISHEFGHQWFGNLVTPTWWSYIWLNEGFASLFAYLGTDLVYPEWNVMEYFIVNEYHKALHADSIQSRPMTYYVEQPKQIIQLFDVISYSKAACVLRMMQHTLGEDNFKLALTDYLKKMVYGSATEEDLFNSLQKIVNDKKIKLEGSISDIMSSWTRQAGYPLLHVERNYKDGSFKITQKSYKLKPNKDDKTKWWIPYNYVSATKPDFSTTKPNAIFKDESITVKGKINKNDWLILNKQLTGYYRVNYDNDNWKLIISQLRRNHNKIHKYNRAQLIADANSFVSSKNLNLKTLFSLLSYLESEEDYSPWYSAHAILSEINRIVRTDKDYKLFHNFIQSIIYNIYEKLGIEEKPKENHFDKYTRLIAILWACEAGAETCLNAVTQKLKDYIQNNTPIKPNLLPIVYCNGLKKAHDNEYNFLYNKLMNSDDEAERSLLIDSLGCSQNENQLRKFAESSISKSINVTLRTQERTVILKSIYGNSRTGILTAIDFLINKYNEYADLTPAFGGNNPLNSDVLTMSTLIYNEDVKKKFMVLIEKIKKHPKVQKDLEKVVTSYIKTNIDWLKANREEIFNTVKEFTPGNRLPNNTIPLHYDVNLVTDVHRSIFDFSGKVAITLMATTEPSENITLNYRQLEIGKVTLVDSKKVVIPTEVKLNKRLELITVYLTKSKLIPKSNYVLTIEYKGELRSDNGGFYRSKSNTNGKLNYIATTQFETTDARHGFPCFDEPSFRANFTISIKHGNNYTALSNMPIDGKPVKEGNYLLTKFKTTPKMSTYLIAIIVSNFEQTSGTLENNTGIVHRVFSRPDTVKEQEFALNSSINILKMIQAYVNVTYALPKMDQVAIPDFAAGAMENWGLVTYREELLLFTPNKSTTYTQTAIATTIAHEYAHQWFGNLVTPKWWTYIWLNEGFASLFAYIGSTMAYPSWSLMDHFIVNEYQKALMKDAGNNPRPMTHYVDEPKEIALLFDVVSYSKAASVIRMMQHALTQKIFTKALTKYLNKMKYQAAVEDDLFDAIRITAKEENHKLPGEIKDFMGSWTSQGGYPLLTVNRFYENGTFSITQEGFNLSPKKEQTDNRLWFIPFNYARENGSDFSNTNPYGYLKKEKEIQVNLKENEKLSDSEWLILNKQTTGYYRVNYDERNWKLIIEALKSNNRFNIHTYNRAQLLSDSHHLTLVKKMDLDLFFDLLTSLEHEISYAPWAIADVIFNYYNEFLRGQEEYDAFKFFINKIITRIYDYIGIDEREEAEHFNKYIRTIAINWACTSGIESCLDNTNKKMKNLIENGEAIAPNLQSAVYCNGLRKATNDEFNHMYNELMKSDNQAERQLLMSSLGCTESEEQLKKFVESSISKENDVTYRPQERINVLRSVYKKGPTGLNVSIEFLKTNYKEYAKITPGFGGVNPLNVDLLEMSKSIANNEQYLNLLKFVISMYERSEMDADFLIKIVENMDKNIKWIEENYSKVVSWMNKYKKEKTKDAPGALPPGGYSSGNNIIISFTAIVMSVISIRLLY